VKPQATPSQFNEAAYWRGTYSGVATYDKGEAVAYQGSSYICLQYDVTGVTPGSDATKWALLASEGDAGATGSTGLASPASVTFGKSGSLAQVTGQHRVKMRYASLIEAIDLSVIDAPTGADIVVDINIDGTTIFPDPGDRPRITAGQTAGAVTVNIPAAAGSFITADIDQVGSGAPGSGLLVQVWATRTA
jgi:hypothetical protein